MTDEKFTCHYCHKALLARGNREFWIRSNHGSRMEIVCGRKACQQAVRDSIHAGEVYNYRRYPQIIGFGPPSKWR